MASKTSQPVTEVDIESYTSLEYVHVAGNNERCEDINYASPSRATRKLPSIPVSKAEEEEEEEDDDDLYELIDDIPNQPSSVEVLYVKKELKEPLIIENVNENTDLYKNLTEVLRPMPMPQPPSIPLQQPSASLPSYPPPSQSIQLPSTLPPPLPPPLPPDVIDKLFPPSIPVDPEPEQDSLCSPSPSYEVMNGIYNDDSDQEDSDSDGSSIYARPTIDDSNSEPEDSTSEPEEYTYIPTTVPGIPSGEKPKSSNSKSEGYTYIPIAPGIPSDDEPENSNSDSEGYTYVPRPTTAPSIPSGDEPENSNSDSEGYTYIPKPTTTIPGIPSGDSISVRPAITSPPIEYLKLHPQQGLTSRSPDPTNDQLQLLIKQMEHMQEMLMEMQTTYVQNISSPPVPPQVYDVPKHIYPDQSMSEATKALTHQSVPSPGNTTDAIKNLSHQSIFSPENMSDASKTVIHQSTADISFPYTPKCDSTCTARSESATCEDSDNNSTQTLGAVQHPDPQAITQMKEVFRELQIITQNIA